MISISVEGCVPMDTMNRDQLRYYQPYTVSDGGITYGYRVYAPEDYNPNKAYPLVMVLHGGGSRGTDNELQVLHGLPLIWSGMHQAGKIEDIIIAAPQQNPVFGFFDQSNCVESVLNDVIARFHIDEDRVYLTGCSMGGMGSWSEAAKFPDRIAAILPADGAYPDGRFTFPVGIVSPAFEGDVVREDVPPEEYEGAMARYAEVLKDMPIWMFQSEGDTMAPPYFANLLADYMRKGCATNFQYTLFPQFLGLEHGLAYRVMMAMEEPAHWLLRQRRSNRFK